MFHSILVPLDGSTFAEQALPLAASIAERSHGVLHLAVVHPWGPSEDAPRPGSRTDREVREDEGAYLNRLIQTVAASYQMPVCEAVLDGSTTSGALVEHARVKRVDLVVACTHEHGPLWRWLSSGVARQLTHRLRAVVLFIKPHLGSLPISLAGFSRILVALDGSQPAESAVEWGLGLAAPDALVTLVHVASHSPDNPEQRRVAQGYLDNLLARGMPHGCRVQTAVLQDRHPAEALVRYAEARGMDLIVLTTRANVSLPRAVFGTVADHVLHHSTLPVLVCHAAKVPAHVGSEGGS